MASREPGGAECRLHRIVQAVSPRALPHLFFSVLQTSATENLTGACDGRQQSIAGERRGPPSRTAGGACTLPQEEGTAGAAAAVGAAAVQEPAHHRQQAAEGRGEVCQDRDASHCAVMATQSSVQCTAHTLLYHSSAFPSSLPCCCSSSSPCSFSSGVGHQSGLRHTLKPGSTARIASTVSPGLHHQPPPTKPKPSERVFVISEQLFAQGTHLA